MTSRLPQGAADLYAVEHPRLVGALTLLTCDRAEAEELVQETFIRVFQRWDRVERLESPGGYARRIALNLAASRFRRLQAARRAHHRMDVDGVHHDPDGAETVAVRAAVAQLPGRQRTALVCRYYLDMNVASVAAHMGVSADSVRSLTKRAVATLRTELGDSSRPQEVPDVR